MSVTTPRLVPFSRIVAPGKVSPLESLTPPFMVRFFCKVDSLALTGRMIITSFSISYVNWVFERIDCKNSSMVTSLTLILRFPNLFTSSTR